jgi:hypothetical protein
MCDPGWIGHCCGQLDLLPADYSTTNGGSLPTLSELMTELEMLFRYIESSEKVVVNGSTAY